MKWNRGASLRGPELRDLLPSVLNKFVKVGHLLFPEEERAPYEHPKVTAFREAEEAKLRGKKRKKKVKKIDPEEEASPEYQFYREQISLPKTGREKLEALDSALLSKPE